MKLTFESKFNVGDIVRLKGTINQKFVINNVISETCPGGTQILYAGVICMPNHQVYRRSDEPMDFTALADKPININENLLEAIN